MTKEKQQQKNAKTKRLHSNTKLKPRKEHGGSLAKGKRRGKRPLNLKQSHHVTLKSHYAFGSRSLFKHKKLILSLIKKNSRLFQVKVYEYSIQGNHIHLLLKAQAQEGLQNFFRVVAGHVAQGILKDFPIIFKKQSAGGALLTEEEVVSCKKNQRKFWSYLLYSRIVSWGREFVTVSKYIQKNTLELMQIITFERHQKASKANSS